VGAARRRTQADIHPGDIVWIPPGVKHWHGATADSTMTHIAIAESQNGTVVTWLAKVSDEQYRQPEPTRQ
jgi:quercetin dioxygenase-like cupin family protein